MNTIYIDVFLCVNFFVDYMILILVRKTLRINTGLLRLIPASLFSAFLSLAVFLPFYTKLFSVLYKILSAALIVFIAYGKTGLRTYIVRVLILFGTSIAYAGTITLIWLWLKPKGIVIYNGSIYISISPLMLIVCTIVVFITLSIYERIKKKSKNGVLIKNVTIITDNNQCSFKSQIDTGMNIKEPFSGLPVIIAEKELFEEYPENNLRVIPYTTLSGEGVLMAFKPKSVLIDGKEVKNGCYVALCKGRINGEIKSLMGNDLSEVI